MNLRDCIASAKLSGPIAQPDDAKVFEFSFPSDDPTFAGHFHGRPIVPGIFELEMARMATEWILGCELKVVEVVKAKFTRPITPEETVRLSLKCSEQDGAIHVQASLAVEGAPAGQIFVKLSR